MDFEDSNATFVAQIKQFGGFVTFRSPLDIWANHATFLVQELVTYVAALLNFIHASKNGGYYKHYWWTTIIMSITVEMVCYNLPELDNFWHSQSTVMFAHGRFPLYIVLLYNAFYYPAMVAVSKLRLAWWAESLAVGLCSVIIDVPYDITGVKMLHWVWHDTDAAIADRTYWVPWTSYYFHTAFSAALHALFFGLRRAISASSSSALRDSICTLVAGLLGMPLGSLLFLAYYHPLHDHYGIHSEVPVLMFLITCMLIVWISSERRANRTQEDLNSGKTSGDTLIFIGVILQYAALVLSVTLAKPENIVRTGLSQMTGPCDVMQNSISLSGKVLQRRKYLCVTDYDEGYFDWHCRQSQKPPGQWLNWYTLCGMPFPNHVEYIAVVAFFCIVGSIIYYHMIYGTRIQTVISGAFKKKKTK